MRPTIVLLLLALAAPGCRKQKPDSTPVEVDVRSRAKYPIILAHGLLAGPDFAPFADVEEALDADGHRAFETRTHPVSTIEERAKLLGEQIDEICEQTGAEKVNVIAHSMGGLDARWLAANGWSDRIASITTVSTPHRGSRAADVTRSVLGPNLLAVASDVAATFNAHLFKLPKHADWQGTLEDLSEDRAREFNAATPDHPDVYYQSFAGLAVTGGKPGDEAMQTCGAMWPETQKVEAARSAHFWLSAQMVSDGPSDGVVSVESAKWGAFRGCIPADHMDEIGFYGNDEDGRRFDHVTFYRQVAAELAELGY